MFSYKWPSCDMQITGDANHSQYTIAVAKKHIPPGLAQRRDCFSSFSTFEVNRHAVL